MSKLMSACVYAVGSYAFYKGMPEIRRYYHEMGNAPKNSWEGRVYCFIHTYWEPERPAPKAILKGIVNYQWLAHLLHFVFSIHFGYYPNTLENYFAFSMAHGIAMGIFEGSNLQKYCYHTFQKISNSEPINQIRAYRKMIGLIREINKACDELGLK